MNANLAGAQVIDLAAHPALRARAAPSTVAAAADIAPREAGDVAIRVAARIARRGARVQPAAQDVRKLRFRSWFPLFRLWRRWRLGLPFSRLWCAPAKQSPPLSSPGGAVRQLKRSPRPAGAHRRRDLSAITSRCLSRGYRASAR